MKSQFPEKYDFPSRDFRLLNYPGMRCYNTVLSNFRYIICQVVAYGRLKTKKNFKLLALKVVAVAYKRFQMQWFDLKFLVFWKTGRLREVVATGGSTEYIFVSKSKKQSRNYHQKWHEKRS